MLSMMLQRKLKDIMKRKIAVLESAIVNARIIDKSNIDTSKVTIFKQSQND